jgi:hypothetical protein
MASACIPPRFPQAAASVVLGVTVKKLLPETVARRADAIVVPGDGREVEHSEDQVAGLRKHVAVAAHTAKWAPGSPPVLLRCPPSIG